MARPQCQALFYPNRNETRTIELNRGRARNGLLREQEGITPTSASKQASVGLPRGILPSEQFRFTTSGHVVVAPRSFRQLEFRDDFASSRQLKEGTHLAVFIGNPIL